MVTDSRPISPNARLMISWKMIFPWYYSAKFSKQDSLKKKAFKTKPEIGLALLKGAVERDSLPFCWVAADELYGDSPAFREGVAALGKWYLTEIKCSTLIWQSQPAVYLPEWKGHDRRPIRLRLRNEKERSLRVDNLVSILPKDAWRRATIKEGSKGPIVCDFAFLRLFESQANLPGPEVWLIIRRNLDDPTVVKFYFSNPPAKTPLTEFVRISGMRWPIETIFEENKGEIGLDHYETRCWLGWHHQPEAQPSGLLLPS